MMKYMTAGAALLLTTTAATAGGIDRSGQFIGVLFEEGGATGSYAQLSFGTVSPDANAGPLGPATTGDPLQDYNSIGLAFKTDFNDQWSAALIFDEPYGTEVEYTSGVFSGTPVGNGQAYIDSTAITGILRYKIDGNFSVHGGVRAQEIGGVVVAAPGILEAESDFDFGFLVGATYERPEIALRVSLTYNSEIDNDLSGTRNFAPIDDFTVTSPESLNLEFQTGIAQDTLLFGTIRHVKWDGYSLVADGANFANFTNNTTTYTVGVGRRLTDDLSVFATIGNEADGVTPSTTALAPTTGFTSVGLGASYSFNDIEISGGVTYVDLGDQIVNPGFDFDDNEAIGVGLRVGYNF